jgi:hypothetical protein
MRRYGAGSGLDGSAFEVSGRGSYEAACAVVFEARTVHLVLTFADTDNLDVAYASSVAAAADLLYAGHNPGELIVGLLADRDSSEILETLRIIATGLFGRFRSDNPDLVGTEVAAILSEHVRGAVGVDPLSEQGRALSLTGTLIASDFDPDDTEVVQAIFELGALPVLCSLASWILVSAVMVSMVVGEVGDMDPGLVEIFGTGVEGGDAVRWLVGSLPDPAPGASVLISPVEIDW